MVFGQSRLRKELCFTPSHPKSVSSEAHTAQHLVEPTSQASERHAPVLDFGETGGLTLRATTI